MDHALDIQTTSETLAATVRREVALYAATSDTATFYPVLDDLNHTYAVIVMEHDPALRPAWILVMARVVDNTIIIDEDTTLEKHVVDALMVNAGIPREKIVLAYKGETTTAP
jgi:XisI protein